MRKNATLLRMTVESRDQELSAAPRWDEQQRLLYAGKIAAARRARGMTQGELARLADVSRGTVGNIESGKTVPQSEVIWRVLGVLDARPDMDPQWSPEVEGWVRLIAPLIERVPDAMRERVMLEVVTRLGNAAQGKG